MLAELQFRRIYAEWGYSSLFEMLVQKFKLSESAAYQKISLMKLIKEIPAAKKALLDGSASVSNLVLVQSFISEKKKTENTQMTSDEKKEIIEQVKNKSYREAKEQLASLNPQPTFAKDKVRPINADQFNIQCTIDRDLQKKLEHIKNLISHKNPNPSMNELLHLMSDVTIELLEKKKGIHVSSEKKKIEKKENVPTYRKVCVKVNSKKKSTQRSRYIPKQVRREVFQRAQGQCQYVSPEGKRCECKRFLEFEHVIPFAKGGLNNVDSLQLFCNNHNALKAKIDFGKDPREYKRSESGQFS